jgi:putative ABC transport system substrate-binding protein
MPAIAFAANPVFAQQTKVVRMGYLSNRSEKGAREAAFLNGLREHGYVDGRNIAIEWRFVAGKLDRLPNLAAELVRLKVDILVTAGIAAALAAKRTTNTIPIVMANASGDPVRQGLVASLARPGGNVTGLVDASLGLGGKRLDLLKQLVPTMSRVAILWEPASPSALSQVREVEVCTSTTTWAPSTATSSAWIA